MIMMGAFKMLSLQVLGDCDNETNMGIDCDSYYRPSADSDNNN